MIDSKGMDSEGMEGKPGKIFGSKLESVYFKSFDFKWSNLYVRNGFRWKIFGLKLGYLLIGKWCDYPPDGGGALIVYIYI